jgi:hypothetical protein
MHMHHYAYACELLIQEVQSMSKKSQMTSKDAARIQSHADSTGKNQDFKARAQSAASKQNK